MLKHLEQQSGILINDPVTPAQDSPDRLERPAILVHAGENGDAVEFQSSDGPITFDDARIKRIVENHNRQITDMASGYGGLEKMPIGAYPPLLDSHEDDSNHRVVGRLASLLRYERRDIPKAGRNIPCVMANALFLGKDTVDRVRDGRIFHLSVGIDEDTDTLGEVSTVVQPAAPGAQILKKGKPRPKPLAKNTTHGGFMANHLEAFKKITAELAKGSELVKKANETAELARFELKKGQLVSRLKGLSKAGKVSPAEMKDIVGRKDDVKTLAKLKDDEVNSVFNILNCLSSKIEMGQRGSTNAVNFSELGRNMKQEEQNDLEKAARENVARLSGGKIKVAEPKSSDRPSFAEVESVMNKANRHLSAVDDKEKDKEDKKDLSDGAMDNASIEGSDDALANMQQALQVQQNQINEMTTYMNRMTGMITDLASKLDGSDSEDSVDDSTEDQSTSDMATDESTQDEKSDSSGEEPAQDKTKEETKKAI